jgi:two-component system chemotaxis response regulator CheB
MKKIRVLIVDDSVLIREMFTQMLIAEPDIEVVGSAGDPYEAREKIRQLNPDVLTLDIEMPKMDGLSFLEKIMTLRPMPVVMASTLTQKGAEQTIRALEIGAFDTVGKPQLIQTKDNIGALKEGLVAKVRAASKANISNSRPHASAPQILRFQPQDQCRNIIAIGASTGGVEALKDIFLRLPANVPPIVITQHMPEHFTRSFAARLDGVSQVRVVEAENHMRIRPGHAYIAPGGAAHLKLMRVGMEYVCKLEEGAAVSSHRPSVDVLFRSVADSVGAKAVGVILTGMGRDGADGLKMMRERGAYTLGQDAASSVVYGMPQMAMKAGAVIHQLPLADIPAAILRYCERKEVA